MTLIRRKTTLNECGCLKCLACFPCYFIRDALVVLINILECLGNEGDGPEHCSCHPFWIDFKAALLDEAGQMAFAVLDEELYDLADQNFKSDMGHIWAQFSKRTNGLAVTCYDPSFLKLRDAIAYIINHYQFVNIKNTQFSDKAFDFIVFHIKKGILDAYQNKKIFNKKINKIIYDSTKLDGDSSSIILSYLSSEPLTSNLFNEIVTIDFIHQQMEVAAKDYQNYLNPIREPREEKREVKQNAETFFQRNEAPENIAQTTNATATLSL